MGIHHEWDAYCFDSAVVSFANALEGEMERAAAGTKNPRMKESRKFQVLARWTDMPDEQRFRSPSGVKKK